MRTIGEQIQAIRKARGYNQDQLAELASLNRVTVAKYESGKIEPGAQSLECGVIRSFGRRTRRQRGKGGFPPRRPPISVLDCRMRFLAL